MEESWALQGQSAVCVTRSPVTPGGQWTRLAPTQYSPLCAPSCDLRLLRFSPAVGTLDVPGRSAYGRR